MILTLAQRTLNVAQRSNSDGKRDSTVTRFKLWLLVTGAVALIAGLGAMLSREPTRETPERATRTKPQSGTSESSQSTESVTATYVGSETCRSCHGAHYEIWQDSHHALAERPFELNTDVAAFRPRRHVEHGSLVSEIGEPIDADANTAVEIVTVGPGGVRKPFHPTRVIGVAPLRQFVIPFERGRYQVSALAFDPARNEWFDVYGEEDREHDEWGYWSNRGMTWNSMCASCHMTNLRKRYDSTTDSYATTWSEIGVGCEGCHGPYSEHVAWHEANPNGVAWPGRPRRTPERVQEMCGSCHARRVEFTEGFRPGDAFLDHYRPVLPDEGEIYYPDGQVLEEDFEYGSFLLSRMNGEGVRCIHCHDPHSGKRRFEGNGLCLQCHKGKIDPASHSQHDITQPGGQCVNCHMPLTTYMQRHPRRDHGFTVPDPLLTREFGIPNACNRCHTDKDTDWAIRESERLYGARLDRYTRHRARLVARARQGDRTVVPDLLKLGRDEVRPAWRAVVAGLARRWLDDATVIQQLREWLKDPSALVRAAAARALEPARPHHGDLLPLLKDSTRAVRVEAAWALRRDLDLDSRAGKELQASMEQNADQPGGLMQLGTFHLDRRQPEKAAEIYERASQWDPRTPQHRGALAIALQQCGRLGEAVRVLEQACALAPNDAQWPYSLGLAKAEAGDVRGAREALEKACNLDPTFARAWYNLGLALAGEERLLEAVDAILRGEQVDPTSPDLPYARATIHLRLNQEAEAAAAGRKALAIDPQYTPALQLLHQLGER